MVSDRKGSETKEVDDSFCCGNRREKRKTGRSIKRIEDTRCIIGVAGSREQLGMLC